MSAAWKRTASASAAAVLLLLLGLSPVLAQEPIPSVDVVPVGNDESGPSAGTTFVFEAEPGQRLRSEADIKNPADVAQTVQLYARDLTFSDEGTPVVGEAGLMDVGGWLRPEKESLTVAAGQTQRVSFTIVVPPSAEPGDHAGVLVAESAPQGGDVKVIARVATRFTVTLPGDATKSFELSEPTGKIDSPVWPARMDVAFTVRNTGRVRLNTQAEVNGTSATGSDLVLSNTVERYEAAVEIPWWGGRVTADVSVATEAGTEERTLSRFVIPWGLIAVLLLLALALTWVGVVVRQRVQRKRAERLALEEKVRQLEQERAAVLGAVD